MEAERESMEVHYRKWERGRLIMGFLIMIVIAIPIITGISIPMPIDADTEYVYNKLSAIPAGETCVLFYAVGLSELPEIHGYYLIKQMLEQGVKVIALGGGAASTWYFVLRGFPEAGVKPYVGPDTVVTIGGVEKRYGVDFVHLGWLPGGDAGKNLFLEDVWAACPQDHYGTPVEDIPMMQNIKSIDDIAWLGDMTSTPFWWINAFIAA
jgi:hypothetical protein